MPQAANSILQLGVGWRCLPAQPLGLGHAAVEGGCNEGARRGCQSVILAELGAVFRQKNSAFEYQIKKLQGFDNGEGAAQKKGSLNINRTRHR